MTWRLSLRFGKEAAGREAFRVRFGREDSVRRGVG